MYDEWGSCYYDKAKKKSLLITASMWALRSGLGFQILVLHSDHWGINKI